MNNNLTVYKLYIVLVIIYSEYITSSINNYRNYLNAIPNGELADYEHAVRLVINKWEGIALSFTLSFIFLIRFLLRKANGVINKISN